MPASEFSDVFVSYRRLDVDFVKRLVEDLQKDGKEVWVDWEDIPPGIEGFADEIKRGLEGADTFIAVLSPDYLDSTYCVDLELAYAAKLKKKIIPIVLKKFEDHKVPESVSHINWIYFTPHAGQDNTYEESFPKILDVMHTDLEHVRQHKRFLLRAIEWDEGHKERSFLLNGEEIENAQNWLALSAGKDPIPTDLHRRYISASVKFRKLQQQLLLSGVTVALVISVVLAVLSFIGFNDARVAQATALANLKIASTAKAEAEENEHIASTALYIASTARADAEANEHIASTARADAETSAELAQEAQVEAEANEALAETARLEAERNLRDARQSQSLFHGDLAQQQSTQGLHQRSLLLGLEALKFNADGITSDSAYIAVHDALHQPIHRTLHLDYPKGILDVIWRDDYQQVLIANDEDPFISCPEGLDCRPRVEIWDVLNQHRVTSLPHELPLQFVFWNQQDNQVLTLSDQDGLNQSLITLWDVETESKIYQINLDHYADWIEWEVGGAYFVTAERSQFTCGYNEHPDCDQRAVVYEYATGEESVTLPQDQPLVYARVSKDGQFVEMSVGNGTLNMPIIYNLASGEPIDSYDLVNRRGAYWRDNDTRIITSKDDAIIAQDVATGDILYSISSTSRYDVLEDIIVLSPSNDCTDVCSELQIYAASTGDYRFTTNHEIDEEVDDPVSLYRVIQDGKYLISTTSEATTGCILCKTAVYVWSLETDELLYTFDYDGAIQKDSGGYAINPDETLLLTHSINDIEHNMIALWDIETGQSVAHLDLDRGAIELVEFDENGKHFTVHRGSIIEIYDSATTRLQHTLSHPKRFHDITILHDENTIASYSHTDFTLWHVVDWAPTLRNPIGIPLNTEVYNDDHSQVVTWLTNDNSSRPIAPNAYVWDVETGRLLFILETDATVANAVWSPNRNSILVSQENCDESCIYEALVFDAKTGEHRATYSNVEALGWYPNSDHLMSSTLDSMQVLDAKTGDIIYTSDVYSPSTHDWNSDYTAFIVPNLEGSSLSIVSYPSDEIIQTISLSDMYFDTHWVTNDQTITLLLETPTTTDLVGFDIRSGDEVYRIVDAGIYEVSHDTTQILMLTADNDLQRIDAITGEIIWTKPTLDEQWTDIIWSPDDTMVILAGFFSGESQMFDVESGEVLTLFPYNQLEWSPDSHLILVLDDNMQPPLWRVYDVRGNTTRFSFQPSSKPVWRHDSRGLVSFDGYWSTDFGDLIQRGENHRVRNLTEFELREFFIKPPPDKEIVDESLDDGDDD
jgi:hypothetical protein